MKKVKKIATKAPRSTPDEISARVANIEKAVYEAGAGGLGRGEIMVRCGISAGQFRAAIRATSVNMIGTKRFARYVTA